MRWWIALIMAAPPGWAAPVLVQGSVNSRVEYRARLKAHPEWLAPSVEYLRRHPAPAAREKLLLRMGEAQEAFLNQNLAAAKQAYLEVVALAPSEDWGAGERDLLVHAHLRLAQLEMERSPERRDHWLEQSLLFGPQAQVDRGLFPPPLLIRRAEIARAARKFDARTLTEGGWQVVLLNGVECAPDRGECAAWPLAAGKVRVTALSDHWQTQTVVVDAREVDRFHPTTVAWVEGECAREAWSEMATKSFSEAKAFWNLDCESVSPPRVSVPLALPTPLPPEPSRSVLRNKWLWIGLGVAAVTTLIVVSSTAGHETQTTTVPTTSYGLR